MRETHPEGAVTIVGDPGDVDDDTETPLSVHSVEALENVIGPLGTALPGTLPASIHAAAQALMHDVGRVTLTVPRNHGSYADAALDSLDSQPTELLIAPGLTDPDALSELVERVAQLEDPPPILFDVAHRATLAEAIHVRDHLAEAASGAIPLHGVLPWTRSLTPGRPGPELVPGSCAAGALWFGHADHLRGLHALERHLDPSTRASLQAHDFLVLIAEGRRGVISILGGAPGAKRDEDQPLGLEARLQAQIEKACASVVRGETASKRLWPLLERQATTVLRDWQRRGAIIDFSVRCDEETNDGAPIEAPVLAVEFALPRRVSSFTLRMERKD